MNILTTDKFYSEGRRSNKVLGLRCKSGHVTVPPRHSCMVCGSSELSVMELSGDAKILSFTQVFAKSKEFPLETPYLFALVRLEEGPNLLGILNLEQSKVNSIRTGVRVKVRFQDIIARETDGETTNEKWPRIFFDIKN